MPLFSQRSSSQLTTLRSTVLQLLSSVCLVGGGLLPLAWQPKAWSAEAVKVTYGLLEFPLSIDALETFAETGEITDGLKFYAQFVDDETLVEFRRFLQQSVEVSPTAVSQLTYSQIGERLLNISGNVIRTETGLNGFYALRAALIQAAADPQGLSILNVIRYYPSSSIKISAGQLRDLQRQVIQSLDYRNAAITAVGEAMEAELAASPPLDLSQLPVTNLEQPGSYEVSQRMLALNRDRVNLEGERFERQFQVDLYLPEGLDQPAPVIVVSHGLGSSPDAFAYLGEHLASYGFVVVIPQHLGSDSNRREAALSGILGTDVVNPVDYVDRPLDISYTLDQLELLSQVDPTLTGRMNLQQVGAIGHSFGGYTVLALAGADLNIERANQVCGSLQPTLNAAPVLQCLATQLPPFSYRLRDPRVKAVMAISPISSIVLGPESLSQIDIPTLIMAGSADFVAGVVQEQIHPFVWLTAPEKYLALVIPSGHTYADATDLDVVNGAEVEEDASPLSQGASLLLSGPDPEQGREYVQELGLAFMQAYVENEPAYLAYLTPAYAQILSEDSLELDLIRSLTPEQLRQAYGGTPPIPIVPAPVTAEMPSRSQPVLEEIAETGVLRGAIRQDAAPFGFIDADGQLTGYCLTALESLATELEQELDRPVRLDITAISTIETRFELVQDEVVHIECGPNTIRRGIPEVAFSTPFFITGTHFLVETADEAQLNPFGELDNQQIGVLQGTTTERFLRQQYPDANVIEFEGVGGRAAGIQAVAEGSIAAFAGDGILSLTEATRQNLSPQDFTLIPEGPLTCDPYGMVLPENDPAFLAHVNEWIASPAFRQLWEEEFTVDLYPYFFFNLDYCATDRVD